MYLHLHVLTPKGLKAARQGHIANIPGRGVIRAIEETIRAGQDF